jgi:hypothetical protein
MNLIYAEPRSGSTCLFETLRASYFNYPVNTISEPYNFEKHKIEFSDISHEYSKEKWQWSNAGFDFIFRKNKQKSLIKHLYYACSQVDNETLLKHASKTIILYRKNQIDRIASCWLSHSYKEIRNKDFWHIGGGDYSDFCSFERPPLPNSVIEAQLASIDDKFLPPIKKMYKNPNFSCFLVSYEDLYTDNNKIKEICDYLEITLDNDTYCKYFPKDKKITGIEQKRKLIPNLGELEKTFYYSFPKWFLDMEKSCEH